MWIVYSKKDKEIAGLSALSDLDTDKRVVLEETVKGLLKPGELADYDALQVTDKEKAAEYLAAFPDKLILTGAGRDLKPTIREPEVFSVYITTDAPDQHPVDGIPEITADGQSSALITVLKIDERNKPQRGAKDKEQLYLRADHGVLKDEAGKKEIGSIALKQGEAKFRLFSESVKRVATVQILSAEPKLKGGTLRVEFV
ncbi:MAG: hypothetical protein EHM45_14310 [Desulfobacteraceae bacterium]|nr:MAG: hypothetical protein EHM45_14310 [Desulfobacteraceae bacterium]